MNFEFTCAGRIIFGCGRLQEVGTIARSYGTRAFVVTGSSNERARPMLAELKKAGIAYETFNVSGEPTTDMIAAAAESAKPYAPELVIAMGGGSVLDTGKAISALITNSGDLMEYLEVIGAGKPLKHPTRPFIAIPTTAGTGTEVTKNAVISSPGHQVKVSMRSPFMLPEVALVDPELTLGLPPALTAATGLDALTQLLEAFVSCKANPMTDGFCREGLLRAGRSIKAAVNDNLDARTDMAFASLMSGLALANAGLGAVHGFAGPLGGMLDAPHGTLCASLLPGATRVNLRALKQRRPDGLQRFAEASELLCGSRDGLLDWLQELGRELKIPSLSDLGFNESLLEEAVAKGRAASSMQGNPIQLTDDELREILTG